MSSPFGVFPELTGASALVLVGSLDAALLKMETLLVESPLMPLGASLLERERVAPRPGQEPIHW